MVRQVSPTPDLHEKIRTWAIFIIGTFLLLTRANAQSTEPCTSIDFEQRVENYTQILDNCKNGILLIEFPAYQRQVKKYDDLLAQPTLSSRKRRRITRLRDQWIEDNKEWIRYLLNAMEQYYTLGEILGYYRTDREKIGMQGEKIWLNTDGTLRSLEAVPTKYAILSPGQTQNQSLDAYFLLNDHFQQPCIPAPQYFHINTPKTWFYFGKEGKRKKAEVLAKKIDRTLRTDLVRYPQGY